MSESRLHALRAQGAHLRDPVRFRYLEALATRMQGQAPVVRELLAKRLDEAVAAYMAGADNTTQALPIGPSASPAALAGLSPLAELNRYIAQEHAKDAAHQTSLHREPGNPADMKSVRRFSDVWSRISAERQLAQALTRGPEHAGPLNSHQLMLRAMSLMHGLSPDYLRRFLSQADALLCLEQMNQQTSLKDTGRTARRTRGKK